jgi:gliding motility-associated-like protein
LTIAINNAPTPTITGAPQVCADQSAVPYSVTVPNATSLYSWSVVGGTFTGTGSTIDVNFNTISPVSIKVTETSSATCFGTSAPIVVTVSPTPHMDPTIANKTICSGAITDIDLDTSGSVAATSYDISLISKDIGLTGTPTTGNSLAANAIKNDVFVNKTPVQLTVVYKVIPNSGAGCQGPPLNITVAIDPEPVMTSIAAKTICSGNVPGVVFTSSVAGSSYLWTVFNISGTVSGTALGNGGAGSINETLINTSGANAIVTYRVTPSGPNPKNCEGGFQDITITVAAQPVMTSLTTNSICSGNKPSLVFTSNLTGTSFLWTVISINGIIGGTAVGDSGVGNVGQILTNTSSTSGTVTYRVVPSGPTPTDCGGNFQDVIVTVEPLPKLTALPFIQTICEGSSSSVILNSPTVPSGGGTMQFSLVKKVIDLGLTMTSLPKTLYMNGETLSDVWNNSSAMTKSVTYKFIPIVSGGMSCRGDSTYVILNVNPLPTISPTVINPQSVPAAMCSNDIVNISISSDVLSTANSWTASVTVGAAEGLSGGAGDLIFQTLRNSGAVPATVRYHVTPKASGCIGTPIDVDIEVDPIPDIILTPPPPVCYGNTMNVPLTSSVAGVNFSWTPDPNNSGVSTNKVSGTAIKYLVKDTLTSAEDFLTFKINAVGPGAIACASLEQSLTVVASPQMDGKFLNDNTAFCEGPKDFLQIQLDGQAPFTMSYTDGTSNFTLTKLGNFKSIPIKPTTTTNYLLISMEDVNGCTISLSSQVLYTVYANVAAGFTVGPIPKFVGGNATVTFTNTSAPLDATQFTYNWTFGDDSSPESTSGAGPFSVNYRLPGRKTVTLEAYNNAAQAAGLSCTSSITKTFNILLDPLVAEFKIDPTKACYPTKIKVIENLSTGDLFKWSVIDQKSRDTVASSNAVFPIFSISNDGSYFVRLVTSSSFTGQTATDTANVILYAKPEAIFDAYPQTVYIPDQEVTTINGSGNTATQWLWEFGDGDTSTDYQPSHKYKFEGVDSLKFSAQYDHGGGVICSSTNYKMITAKQGGVAKIPNAFTPSTAGPSGGVGGVDLYNYVFLPQVKGVEEFNMQIFDRWGNLIFESNNQTIGWDGYDQHGKLMPGGVYVYKLTLRLSDQQRTTQVGDVTLIR